MNTVTLIGFITSFAFLWSLLIVAIFWIVVKKWADKAEREAASKKALPPFIPMNDPEKLNEILEFRRNPLSAS